MRKSDSVGSGKSNYLDDVPSIAPGLDLGTVVENQCKNIEALTQANKLAIEGIQAVVRHQFEIGRQTIDVLSTTVRDLMQSNGSLEDRVARQSEYSRQAFEKGLSSAREISQVANKVGSEAVSIIGSRMIDCIAEAGSYAIRVPAR